MNAVVRLRDCTLEDHPPYRDAGLTGQLGAVFESADGWFSATFWIANGPGRLLEQPQGDELICILEGEAVVEWHGQRQAVGPGDVILWVMADPPVVFVPERLLAFCPVYKHD